MATGNVTLSGNVSGGPDGARTFGPLAITASSAVTQETSVSLSVGANTVTVPSGATCAMIVPPNAATPVPNPVYGGTLTLKGVTGDTGVALSNKWPSLVSWDTPPGSIVITASATGTLIVWFM